MDTPTSTTPSIDLPTAQVGEPQPPVAPPVPPHRKLPLMPLLSIIIVILTLIAGFFLFSQSQGTKQAVVAPSTPTPAPTRVPNRKLSTVATDSAFMALEGDVTSLSTRVQEIKIQDTTLNPPSLELPLGFSK